MVGNIDWFYFNYWFKKGEFVLAFQEIERGIKTLFKITCRRAAIGVQVLVGQPI